MSTKLPTLTINHTIHYILYISLKGLSFKAINHTYSIGHDLCREDGKYYLHIRFKIDGNTCKIKKDELIKYLKELHKVIPFGKIKQIGRYELTSEQLMEEILKP